MTLHDIEKLTKEFADARAVLVDRMQAIEDDVRQVKKRHRAALLRAVDRTSSARLALEAALEDGRHLFEKPRTRIFHAVRVGIMKGKGGLDWSDDAQVVRLIRKHLPESAETLIRVRETPVKPALAQLPAADLKRLGVTVVDAGDEVFVKPADSEIDKLVDAFLQDEQEDEEVVA